MIIYSWQFGANGANFGFVCMPIVLQIVLLGLGIIESLTSSFMLSNPFSFISQYLFQGSVWIASANFMSKLGSMLTFFNYKAVFLVFLVGILIPIMLQQLLRRTDLVRQVSELGMLGPFSMMATQEQWDTCLRQVVRELHTEKFLSDETIHKMGHAELSECLQCSLAAQDKCQKDVHYQCKHMNRDELVEKLTQLGGTSHQSCPICMEDYQDNQDIRILRCGHRYHIECIDLWLLNAIEKRRVPCCPMCNTPFARKSRLGFKYFRK